MRREYIAIVVVAAIITGCSAETPQQELGSDNIVLENTEWMGVDSDKGKGPYISITYGRDNPAYKTGREIVYYTYDIETKQLKEECTLPYDSQYACGVVSKAQNTVYYSARSEMDNLASCDGLWSYQIDTGESTFLEAENWSYNNISIMEPDKLLVMAVTREHPIHPALFDIKSKTFTYMPDVNSEPMKRYSCGPVNADYNYKTQEIVTVYQDESEMYSHEYLSIESPIDTYIALANKDLEKDLERIYSISLMITDQVVCATQISENELLVEIVHQNLDTGIDTTTFYSLLFEEGEGILTPLDYPYPNSRYWKTIDDGETFFFLDQSEEQPERGLFSYCPKTGELSSILPGNTDINGHVINFSIVESGN